VRAHALLGVVVPIRPEAERKLRADFQRRVDQRRDHFAAQLTHAEQLAAWYECGVVGVFSAQARGGIRRRAYVMGLLPLAAIPVLIAGVAIGIPGVVPVLGAFPFAVGAWFGLSLWRGRQPRRRVWLYVLPRTHAAGRSPTGRPPLGLEPGH
jgi:hypothetical protein